MKVLRNMIYCTFVIEPNQFSKYCSQFQNGKKPFIFNKKYLQFTIVYFCPDATSVETPIESTELMEVTDFKRKLVIKNVHPSMDRAFTCTVR